MSALPAAVTKPQEGGATFSLRHRLFRLAWSLAWTTLCAWTPPSFRPWRRMVLRLFGASIAPTSGIYGSVRIWYPPHLQVGHHAFIGPGVRVYNMAPVRFGDYSLASQGAHICAGTHEIDDVYFQLVARPIEIGAHAWIAAEAFVGPGVRIGEGAVLGARAVAFRDLAPWSVYAGNPATRLRERSKRVLEGKQRAS